MKSAVLAFLAIAASLFAKAPATSPTIAIGVTVKPGIERAEIAEVMPEEIRATVKLYLDGKIQQWYSRSDGKGVYFILNCASVAESEVADGIAAVSENESSSPRVHAAESANATPIAEGQRPMKASDLALTDLRCACATSRQVARTLTQLYDSQMRSTGIEAPQFALLMTLEKQGPCSQVEIGSRYVLDKTTVSRNLQQLGRNGWVEARVGTDRRVREFALTAKGKARLAAAKPEWKKAQARLQSTMSSREWDDMFQVFRTVTEKARAPFD